MEIDNSALTKTIRSHLQTNRQHARTAIERMASGSRINHAKEDPARLAIANRMTSGITALSQTMRNASDGLGLAVAAENGLDAINERLQRARELTVAASNDVLSNADRDTIGNAIEKQLDAIDEIAGRTRFNGLGLLDGARESVQIQVGDDDGEGLGIRLSQMDSRALGLRGGESTPPIEPVEPPGAGTVRQPGGFEANGRRAADDAVFAFANAGQESYEHYEVLEADDGSLYVRDENERYYAVYYSKVTQAGGSINGPEAENGDTVELGFSTWSPVEPPAGLAGSATTDGRAGAAADASAPTADPNRAGPLPSLARFDAALNQLDRFRSDLGATQNRLDAVLAAAVSEKTTLASARSRTLDADYAAESVRLASAQLLEQAGISVLAQANQARRHVVSLLG